MPIPGPFQRIPWSCHPWLLVTMALCVFAFSSFAAASSQQSTRAPQSFDGIAAQADQARDADNLEQAVVLYRRALGMQPGWVEGWWSLGTILYDRDNYADAARA